MIRRMYESACEKGIANSCHYLGDMYGSGRGVPKDTARYMKYYKKACDAGPKWCCKKAGR